MVKVILDEYEKESVEKLIGAVLTTLYEQQQCGIGTVSTKIEMGALEEIRQRVQALGEK